ncbi:NfnB Nitroreductase [uncultured Caudovirales phage]|uniref:NfnB Nitroreductase n=1 Tax=uncultured Caudovirales phage TaxID=2100421 RepID=A0A6J5TAD2_9CAUD|nr:NfnB Nitroreductase [uncultured Caudovirales phage]
MKTRLSAYQTRFGAPITEPAAKTTAVIEQQLKRSTCRSFKPGTLEDGVLELLMASAQSAASSGFLQTYSVLSLTTPEEKAKLFTTAQSRKAIGAVDGQNVGAINNCSVFLIWIADLHRVDFILRNTVSDPELLKQPTRAEYHLKAVIDATLASQAFAISAESMGLGVMYCGAIRQIHAEHFEQEFNFPKLTFPIFGMAVGYPGDDFVSRPKPRLSTDIVLHKGKYNTLDNMDDLTEYNKIYEDKFDYFTRLAERMSVSYDKTAVSNSLKQMGFNFD